MDLTPLAATILALMTLLEPVSAYRETYPRTARAIATASMRSPLFSGDSGAVKTAYLLTSVADFESGFRPDAEGDCDQTDPKTKMCVRGSRPHSFCLLQISESNFRAYRTTREEVQTSIDKCVDVALRMMHQSFAICRARPLEERLAWYAGGGNSGCPSNQDATAKSRHRVAKALWLFGKYPARDVVESEQEALNE